MPEGLQLIIGSDSKNNFTVYKDTKENKHQVYFGMSLFEAVENNKNNPELKLMLARLYNPGVKVKTLIKHFGFSYPTYKHWGDALKSGDEERLYWALSGQGGGGKKLKPDVVAFITHDFEHVYTRNKYSYGQEIRQDIKDVYQIEPSAECIRPLLGKLKRAYLEKQSLSEEEKKSICQSFLG